MTLYQIKPKFQALLRPLVKHLAARGVTANQVTLAAAAGSLVIGALVAALAWLPAVFLLMPVWLFMRMALNAVDGMLAREHGQQSVLGAYLNELGDIVSDLALILPFALVSPFGAGEVMVFAVLAVIVECAGLIGPLAGASRRYDGPLGKSDRALVLGALGLWVGLGLSLAYAAHWLWVLLSLLSLLTIANRVRRGVAEAEQLRQARAQAAPRA
ncbi:CDP-alcohol phosphatidyltransferase family protein [Cupriavidus sp. 2MCAB6]|uniref:CDP-alcohol phosphatidyltransferase family protein n=1 Tax=Cupriavidus sp. 2MCAB6 TaxID=3232981 RepID=UPI003F8ECA0D